MVHFNMAGVWRLCLVQLLATLCITTWQASANDELGVPLSCADLYAQGEINDGEYEIDPDGDGVGLPPVKVECSMSGGRGITIVHHSKESNDPEDRKVDGFEEPGSFAVKPEYNADYKQVVALADLSGYCEQYVSYVAHGSVMFWKCDNNRAYAYWRNRNEKKMLNWGGAPTGTVGCGCSIRATGCAERLQCNADANTHTDSEDEGFLNDKSQLPVSSLHFGDTGEKGDKEYGYYKLGPLKCSGGPTSIEPEAPWYKTNTDYFYRYLLPDLGPGECRIEFKVQACNDAFIGLSESMDEQNNLYEINLGGWGNTKSVIRCSKQGEVQVKYAEPVLDCDSSKGFWVSWCDHCIRVGRQDENSFMSYCPQRTVAPRHIAFTTGYSADGSFQFASFFAKDMHTCEHEVADINCGDKYINIMWANYGRHDRNLCIHTHMSDNACSSPKSMKVVSDECQGQKQCQVSASNGIFGDPCCGTFKYLQIKYTCGTSQRSIMPVIDSCMNNQCSIRGGECVSTGPTEYRCICRANYAGEFCEKEFKVCHAWGDPHYTDFSGDTFDYQGKCKYILAQPCTERPDMLFKVIGVNEEPNWSDKVTYNRGLEITLGNIEITVNTKYVVLVNNIERNVPFKVNEDVCITSEGKFLLIESFKIGLKIYWDTQEVFKIMASAELHDGNMCGLCGGFQKREKNHVIMRAGDVTTNEKEFGDSWIANPHSCDACKDCVPISFCDSDEQLRKEANDACFPIKDNDGIFAIGHAQFDADVMYSSCIYDLCSKEELDNKVRCRNLEEYANRILQETRSKSEEVDTALLNWRETYQCPYVCPTGSTYSLCASTCQRTCYQQTSPPICSSSCVEGCECSADFLMQNGVPIPVKECGCRDGDEYFRSEQTWFTKFCNQLCSCGKDGRIDCHPTSCVQNSFCGAKNEKHGCHCNEGYVGDGTKKCQMPCPAVMGNEPAIHEFIDEGDQIILDLFSIISCEGYITSFTVKRSADSLRPVNLIVLRPKQEDADVYLIVGSALLSDADDTMILDADKIPVHIGDMVAYSSDRGTIYYDESITNFVLTTKYLESLEPLTEVSLTGTEPKGRVYSVQFQLESSDGCHVEPYMFGDYLGVQSLQIQDTAMTASTERGESIAPMGRLDNDGEFCEWTADLEDQEQWLQVDLGQVFAVTGVVMQGPCDNEPDSNPGCVISFNLQYSDDGDEFMYLTDADGLSESFDGTCVFNKKITNYFNDILFTRYIRFVPTEWKNAISMRVEVIGRDVEVVEPAPLTPRNLVDDTSTAVLFLGNPFRSAGYVTGVSYLAFNDESFTFIVWRPTEEPSTFKLIGRVYVSGVLSDKPQKFRICRKDRIPVQQGDVFGILFDEPIINFEEDDNPISSVLLRRKINSAEFKDIVLSGVLEFPEKAGRSYALQVMFRKSCTRTVPPVMSLTGMGLTTDGLIKDDQITASSYCDSNSKPWRARLNMKDQFGQTGGWCGAEVDQTAYIQVDFPVVRRCGGLTTQGMNSETRNWYVAKYYVQCRHEDGFWRHVADKDDNTVIFSGNSDRDSEVYNYFPDTMICKQIRIYPVKWCGDFPAMRFDLLGLTEMITKHPEVGFSVCKRDKSGSTRVTFVLPSKQFESNGHFVGLRFRTARKGGFKVVIFRPKAEINKQYVVVGVRHIKTNKKKSEDQVTFEKPMPVRAGDMLGFSFTTAILQKSDDSDDMVEVVWGINRDIHNIRSMKDGTIITFTRVAQRAFSVVADFEASSVDEVLPPFDSFGALGLQRGTFPTTNIEVSSSRTIGNIEYGPQHSPLCSQGEAEGWMADFEDDKRWIQVDTGTDTSLFAGFKMQGCNSLMNWWCTKVEVTHSKDGDTWSPKEIFEGNTDGNTIVQRYFKESFTARYLRIYITEFNDRPCFRFDVLGTFDTALTEYGPPPVQRNTVDDNNYIILLTGSPFESDGVITEWSYFPVANFPFKAGVWRRHHTNKYRYMHVGSNDIPATTPDELATYVPDEASLIPFRQGDVIGISFTDAVIPYDTSSDKIDIMYSRNSGKMMPTKVGRYRKFKSSGQQAYSITASIKTLEGQDVPAVDCVAGLGIENDLIPDESFTGSSNKGTEHLYSKGRLNGKECWAPNQDAKYQYIQVNLGGPTRVTGVAIQGCPEMDHWVTKYKVQLSSDEVNWHTATGQQRKNFFGNKDKDTPSRLFFDRDYMVQYVRIFVLEWNNGIGLRFEVLGCPIVCEKEWGPVPLAGKWSGTLPDNSFIVNIGNPVTCNSVITEWKIFARRRGSVNIYVLQPLNILKGIFTIVGKTYISKKKLTKNEVSTIPLSPRQYIQVRSGSMIAFSSCKSSPIYGSTSAGEQSEYLVIKNRKIEGLREAGIGDEIKLKGGKTATAAFSITAVMSDSADVKISRSTTPPISCSGGLGMESGKVTDDLIQASTHRSENGPELARLNGAGAWIPDPSDQVPCIEIALGKVAFLTGIVTQGDPNNEAYITSYSIEYTHAHDFITGAPKHFQWIAETNTVKDNFAANMDGIDPKVNYFKKSYKASYVRLTINSWSQYAALRMEILGCRQDNPCKPNPCKQNAQCTQTQSSLGYSCNCPQEWGGDNCEVGVGLCTALGDPHYHNFDGQKFNFQGDCTYIMTRTTMESTLYPFEILVDNMKVQRNPRVSTTREVFINVNGKKFDFKQGRVVYVDGERITCPYDRDGVAVTDAGGCEVKLQTDFGLTVLWNGKNKVYIFLPADYSNEVEGLCGNYNSDNNDDYIIRGTDGEVTSDISTFGESWSVDPECEGCKDCQEENDCRASGNLEAAQQACGILVDTNGPFVSCHAVKDPKEYYEDCLLDYCAQFPSTTNLCDDIDAYSQVCVAKKIHIGNWRHPNFCHYECPVGMSLQQMATDCPNTCGNPEADRECSGPIGPKCVCKDSMFLEDGNRCIPSDNCGCMYDGTYHRKGEHFIAADCSEKCFCGNESSAVCHSVSCHDSAQCEVHDGVRDCYCIEGYMGDGYETCTEIITEYEVTVCESEPRQDIDPSLALDIDCKDEFIDILEITYSNSIDSECPSTSGATPQSYDVGIFIKDRCLDQNACVVPVDRSVFGDLGSSDLKELYVRYTCRPSASDTGQRNVQLRELLTCDTDPLIVSCPGLKISMTHGFYGRDQDSLACQQDATTPQGEDCSDSSAFNVLGQLCHGVEMCVINPAELFDDPCPGISKYLEIHYRCEQNPVPFVAIEEYCDPNPCDNGVCEAISIEPFYNCKCNPGFTGDSCDTGEATCTALGDPHYISFDGKMYDFMGPCQYTLVKSADGDVTDANGEVVNFEVIVINEASRRNPAMSSTIEMIFTFKDYIVKLKKGGLVYIDDLQIGGYADRNLGIYITEELVTIKTKVGIIITWDKKYLFQVSLSAIYFDHVEGLCGNYNQNSDDDFTTRIGFLVEDPVVFGQSWFVNDENNECSDCTYCDLPVACSDPALKSQAQDICQQLVDAEGPFKECNENLGVLVEAMYTFCMIDVCSMPDSVAYCEDFKEYSTECFNNGFIVNWRNPNLCPIECPANMVYSPSTSPCPNTCMDQNASMTCSDPDHEDCVCPNGKIREREDCIPSQDCGCKDPETGFYYQKDVFFMTPNCAKSCQCNGPNQLECMQTPCSDNEYCGISEGEPSCLCIANTYRDEVTTKCEAYSIPRVLVFPPMRKTEHPLNCEQGKFINIISARYGDPNLFEVCLVMDEPEEGCNSDNSLEVSRRVCQDKEMCFITPDETYFGDPCYRGLKYFYLEYACEIRPVLQDRTDVLTLRVCEGAAMNLVCSHISGGTVVLVDVFYGRRSGDMFCLDEDVLPPDSDVQFGNALVAAEALCGSKSVCNLQATSSYFDDLWTSKVYLEVTYRCADGF